MEKRVFGLDLMRAVAIIFVINSHYSLRFAESWAIEAPVRAYRLTGFFGVELFFALSGFLIGNLLFDISDRGMTFKLIRRFWMRRWMRTLPAYWIVLAFSAILVWLGLNVGSDFNLVQFATLTQNVVTPYRASFFGVSWSLVIEEWFYLLFPLAMWGMLALLGQRGLPVCIAAFIVSPMVAREIGWHWLHLHQDAGLRKIFLLQLDPIAYGALAAYLMRRYAVSPLTSIAVGALGVVVLAITWMLWTTSASTQDWFLTNGRFMGASTAGALMVFSLSRLKRAPLLAALPIRFFSIHAYTLYLVHEQIYELAADLTRNSVWQPWTPAVAVVALLSFAAALTRFVELPLMALRPAQFPTPSTVVPDQFPNYPADAQVVETPPNMLIRR